MIVGAGGHGREILDVVKAINDATPRPEWDFVGFVDDGNPDRAVLARRGAAWLGGVSRLSDLDASFVVGIGSPAVRRQVAEWCGESNSPAKALRHPLASIGSDVDLGPGTILMAGARLTTNIRVGPHVHVGVNSTVHHDTVIEGYVMLGPGSHICGGATVGAETWIGVNASINQNVRVGSRAVVGAGAAVVRDVPPGATVLGVPAKVRRP